MSDLVPAARPPHTRSRRTVAGWVSLAVGLVLVVLLGLAPAPYVIEAPGPVFDTLGVDAPVPHSSRAGVPASGRSQPVITVTGRRTYPSTGNLFMLTVSSFGRPGNLPSWMNVVAAWFDADQAVLPVDAVYPPDTSVATQNKVNEALMRGSQEDAIAAALHHLGIPFTQRLLVTAVAVGMPAAGVLDEGDEITAVAGRAVAGVAALRHSLASRAGEATTVTIVRRGERRTVRLTPRRSDGAAVIGVGVRTDYSFPFDVRIRLHQVGGPSAGMMFALGIIDKLTPGSLTGGRSFAGTGTIEPDGEVGPIGGIVQKAAAARAAGARYFLAPRSNCAAVRGHIPQGLHVFAVSDLDDSLAALKAVRTGASIARLPTCAAQ